MRRLLILLDWKFPLFLLLLLASASAEVHAAACIYDAQGKPVYQPPGAECRNVSRPDSADATGYEQPVVEPKGPWLPLRPGSERLYEVVIEHGRSLFGDPLKVSTYRGTQHHETVVAPDRLGEGVFEERITTQATESKGDVARIGLQRFFLRPSPRGYELLSSNRYWFGRRRNFEHGRGARLLPAEIRQGVTWHVGVLNDYKFSTRETGEILGFQDVETPAGIFKGCLAVRYTGVISTGGSRLSGESVGQGRVIRNAWYARGVGLVRQEEEGQLEAIVNHERLLFTMKAEGALKGVRGGTVPAAPKPR
jgi:hypothetical protein